jgi:hypothetical protein
MASFTDTLVGFNPYYQQIPVDDYVRVGMQKQLAYNEGVKKTQDYIDSIAGMEVIKDVHKQYLQKRVDQLSGQVSKIVGEDFSRQQLVNSVGHLTAQIGADPILQNAQLSTQRYKQGASQMNAAIQEGKSSPSNEWMFQSQVSNWLSDGDVSTSLNASYTPYTDVNKKVLAVIKDLHPDAKIEDIPFVRGDNGQIVLDKDGQPKIDFAMMRKSIKGLEPERIQGALRASLDPNDLRQLQIDGLYNYRGVDKVGMKKIADESYSYRLGQINDTIKGLMVERAANIGDASIVKAIDQKIDALSNRAEQYQQNYKRDISNLDNNLDGYKTSTYMQNYISRFGDGFAYAEHSLTYENNPYFMAAERRRENDIKWQEFVVNKQFQAADLELKREKLGIDYQELKLKEKLTEAQILKLKGKAGGSEAPLTLTGTSILEPIEQEQFENLKVDDYIAETETKSNAIDTQKMALLAQLRPDLVKVVRNPDGRTKRYEYNVAGKNPNTVKSEAEATILRLKDSYDKGDPVDDATRTYFTGVGNTDRDVSNRKFALTNLEDQAKEQWDLKPITDRIPPMRVQTVGGETYQMSGRELFDFHSKLGKIQVNVPGYGGPGQHKFYQDDIAEKLLTTPAERYVYNIMKKNLNGERLSENEIKIVTRVGDVAKTAVIPSGPVIRGRAQYLNNALKDIIGVSQPVGFPVESFKTEDKGRVLSTVIPLLNSIKTSGKGNESKLFDYDEIREMLTDKRLPETTFTLEAKGSGKYAIGIHNEFVTGKRREIEITKPQAEQLFGAGKFLDDFEAIRNALQLSKGTGRVTTDVQGKGRETAFSLNNGLLNRYGVQYHVEDPLKNGSLQVRLYIYDRQGDKQWHETTARFGQLLNEAQVTQALSAMPDSYIDEILGKKNQ